MVEVNQKDTGNMISWPDEVYFFIFSVYIYLIMMKLKSTENCNYITYTEIL